MSSNAPSFHVQQDINVDHYAIQAENSNVKDVKDEKDKTKKTVIKPVSATVGVSLSYTPASLCDNL